MKLKRFNNFEKKKVTIFKENINTNNKWFVEYGLGGGFSGGIQY